MIEQAGRCEGGFLDGGFVATGVVDLPLTADY